ncbi:MAG TPA: DNA polymerase IV [Bacteroidota bacterium]|nr:DNA polymerase IV [Bacteroidota bacterium]
MSDRKKYIAHLDLDCFFVSVERIKNPSLNGKPVAVGGSPEGRGVIASASYEARAFGVRSAMPARQALQKCPQLIMVGGHHREYGIYSDRLYTRMLDFTPIVERASIDEMYLDFTGCESLYNNDLPSFMKTLQQLVWKEFSLPCTIALASNKILAKIAAGTVKPAGTCFVPHGKEAEFLAPLGIETLPGVGSKTAPLLHERGFHTVGDIQHSSLPYLKDIFGESGEHFFAMAMGKGPDVLTVEGERKSIGREETFGQDTGHFDQLANYLRELTEDVCSTLRSHRWKARTITVKLRYSDFRTFTRAVSVEPTDDDIVVFNAAKKLLRTAYSGKKKIRLLGVRLSQFNNRDEVELDLFPDKGKRAQMFDAVDKIRGKFGDDVIHIGRGE